MKRYIIEGKTIKDIQSMCDAFAKAVNAPNKYFGKSLQSFDDCLFGGFGLECPCEVVWKDSNVSRQYLNEHVLIDYCEDILQHDEDIHEECRAEGKQWVLESLENARQGKLTMFDEIVEWINSVSERSEFKREIHLILK